MGKTFVEAVYEDLKGKPVEIHLGNATYTMMNRDSNVQLRDVIRGEIVGAVGDMLMVQVSYNNKSTCVRINGYNIFTVIDVTDKLSTYDAYSHEHEPYVK